MASKGWNIGLCERWLPIHGHRKEDGDATRLSHNQENDDNDLIFPLSVSMRLIHNKDNDITDLYVMMN